MKKLYLFFFALCALGADTFAKPVEVATAKAVGYNFMSGKSLEGISKPEDLQLVYTTTSATASPASCFYVFNLGSYGFVMVSADDEVKPVLGYSLESIFDPNNVPAHINWWLQQYTDQIAYVIENKLTADATVKEEWILLLSGKTNNGQNKTTTAGPLLTTKWNQNPYYNALCPKSGSQSAVTGCVATTMAQLMKYWGYPAKGIGSHSYTHSNFGPLSANFSSTTYNWSSMPNQLTSTSTAAEIQAVATLMYHAGVAVEMDYGINGSGAQSLEAFSGMPSAEYALKTFFGYVGAKGIYRSSYNTAQWKSTLIAELDNGRPFYYAGRDPNQNAGHAWVCDGYDGTQNFHMNWGWGGMYNGYFSADILVPGTGGTGGGTGNFSSNQRAIIDIQAPGAITPDAYESNNSSAAAKTISSPGFSNNKASLAIDANFHNTSDEDFYEIAMPSDSRKYRVTARLHDLTNSGNGKTYTVDAKFAGNTSRLALSSYNDVSLANSLSVSGGSSAYFRVIPATVGAKGTYLLDVTITDIATGIEETISTEGVRIYPNPASHTLHIDLGGMNADGVQLLDIAGRTILKVDVAGKSSVDIDVKNVAGGSYFVIIQAGDISINKQVTISK